MESKCEKVDRLCGYSMKADKILWEKVDAFIKSQVNDKVFCEITTSVDKVVFMFVMVNVGTRVEEAVMKRLNDT